MGSTSDKFSTRLIDFAERFADMTDAAQGRGSRQGGIRARWILLPAAGAGLYALGASGSLVRQAKNVAKEAKNRAVELPGRFDESSPSSDAFIVWRPERVPERDKPDESTADIGPAQNGKPKANYAG